MKVFQIDDRDWSKLTLGGQIHPIEVESYSALPALAPPGHIARLKSETEKLETQGADYGVHQRAQPSLRFVVRFVSFVGLCAVLGMPSNVSVTQALENPFKDAKIVWHMKTLQAGENYPLTLKANGYVQVGQKLDADEYAQSLRRGGDGFATVLNEKGWLSLDLNRAKTLRPGGDAVSLYVRAWVGPDGNGTLFFSDFIALAVHPKGLAIGFLGVRTPHGKVFRELPLGILERGRWLDLVVRVGNGKLDFFCNGILRSSIPIRQGLCSPFADVLQIGAFMWSGPDLYEHKFSGFHNGKIDTVALWDYVLLDSQVAFFSGLDRVRTPTARSQMDQAVQDYNAFFDASVNKDTASCNKLWKSLRDLADQDPYRPSYHLTQPLGAIFDPAGAYYYGGRYHVFSYHNILNLLTYCSLDHYVSDDLVHWSEWPIGPWADSDLDVYGIWLMNHFIDDKGVPSVIYTALGTDGKHGVLARSIDGLVSYQDKKAVLIKYHHDGHVWKEGDMWYTITSKMYRGTRPGTLGDGVMLWSSSDLEHWLERGEIFTQPKYEHAASLGDRAGFMEFPYLLPFGDKDVMMLGGHPVRYWVGRFDREQLKFIPDKPYGLLLDYSNPFHCFNPLCVDQKGPGGTARRIVMALYTGLNGGSDKLLPWDCAHAMPRSLELDRDHLRQEPLPEMQSLRGAHHSQRDITVTPNTSGYINTHGDAVEIIAEFEPRDARCFGLKVRASADGASFIRIHFDTATNEYGVDGNVSNSGGGPTYIPKGQPVRMHVFLDKLLLEAFINGQTCTTAGRDRNPHSDGIDLFSEGGTVRCTRLDIWNMRPAKPEWRHKSRRSGFRTKRLSQEQGQVHFNFTASATGIVGPAPSFALGDGAVMVSAIWGLVAWKEFRGATPRVRYLLALIFIFFIAGAGLDRHFTGIQHSVRRRFSESCTKKVVTHDAEN